MTNNMDELNDKFKKSAEKFSFIPSPGIWENIESDIRKRERKRRFIIFFFLSAAILTGGIFLFRNHSTDTGTQTSLQKNNSTELNATKQNSASKKNDPAEAVIPAPKTFSEKNNQVSSHEIKRRPKQSSNPVASSITTAAPQITSDQDDLTANQQQTQITTSITTTISQVISDSVKSSPVTPISKDTLQPETKRDSLLAAKTDTIKKDSSATLKDTIKTVPQKSKWSIAIGVAPTRSYTKQEEKGDYQIVSNYRDSSDKTLLTWNYHLAINYKVIPELEIFTGIGIVNIEQEILNHQAVIKHDTIWGSTLPTPTVIIVRGYFNINGDSTGTVKNKSSYLEIPAGIRYNLLPNHKFNIALQPEISFNKLISFDGYIYNYQNRTYEKINSSDLKTWLVSFGVGLSLQYAILKNVHFEFTPYYKSFQKSIYNDTYPVNQRFQQTEFRLSLRYLVK